MNIAGFCIQGFAHEFPLERVDLHLDINTRGAILGTRIAAEQMLKQGSGHIINMCSLAGLAPVPGASLYSASKFALRGFSLAAYYELKPRGIHISLVEPDLVDTAKLQTQLIYGYAAAAVGFSAPRILQLEEIEAVFLERVLEGYWRRERWRSPSHVREGGCRSLPAPSQGSRRRPWQCSGARG